MSIPIKTPQEIEIMSHGGKILAKILEETCKKAQPGISTHELDQFAESLIRDQGATPGFKGYHGFPATLCTCINAVIVHGIPRKDEILKEGDILTIDCGVIYKNMYTDAARTISIGNPTEENTKLITTAYAILEKAISKAIPENKLSDISKTIENEVNISGYHVVKELTGHGIGYKLHEEPIVPNYWDKTPGPTLKPGMTLAIEPIFAVGTGKTRTLSDKWTIVTTDYSKAIQVEQTIVITQNGNKILTKT